MEVIRRYGIVLVATLVIGATVAAYLGGLPGVIRGTHADKALHFLLFGLIAFFWVLRWGDGRIAAGRLRLPIAVVVPFALAALEEAAQSLSPRRKADLIDLSCDLLGLVTFWWLARRLAAAPGRRR